MYLMYFSHLLVNFVHKTIHPVPLSSLMQYLSLQALPAVIKSSNQQFLNYFLHEREKNIFLYFIAKEGGVVWF